MLVCSDCDSNDSFCSRILYGYGTKTGMDIFYNLRCVAISTKIGISYEEG